MAKLEVSKTRKDKDKEFEFLMNVKINAELRLALRTKAFEQDTTISNVARDILKKALGLAKAAPKKAPVKRQVRTSAERLASRVDYTKSEVSRGKETKIKKSLGKTVKPKAKKPGASPVQPKEPLKVIKGKKPQGGSRQLVIE